MPLAASLLWRLVDRRGVEPLEVRRPSYRKEQVMGLVLLILLVLVLLGALPAWPYSRGWGYRPTGIVGVILVIVVVLLLTGRL
jgi:sterol desaturase/sphingolipid hydroxylase (fatty acid hydroxylase superfamily)